MHSEEFVVIEYVMNTSGCFVKCYCFNIRFSKSIHNYHISHQYVKLIKRRICTFASQWYFTSFYYWNNLSDTVHRFRFKPHLTIPNIPMTWFPSGFLSNCFELFWKSAVCYRQRNDPNRHQSRFRQDVIFILFFKGKIDIS